MNPTSDPLVSIILPVHNGGLQLAVAVHSIVAQTLRDWELIVIDDGSSDGAIEDLRRDLGDSRLVISGDSRNVGLSARLNEGVSMARGRYIARMDHDDIAHPDRLRLQVDLMTRQTDVDLCGARCVAMDEVGSIIGALPQALTHEEICAQPWMGLHLAHPTWLGKAEWFRKNRYREPGPFRCEDQELLLRSYANSRFAAVSKSLLSYRVRKRQHFSTIFKTRRALAEAQVQRFWRHGPRNWAALSILVAASRIAADGMRVLTGGLAPVKVGAEPGEIAEWSTIIADLQICVGNSAKR